MKMSIALKTEWIGFSKNTDINLEIEALEKYCVGNVRFFKLNDNLDSSLGMKTKLEFEVFAETDVDEFWDLIDSALDDAMG